MRVAWITTGFSKNENDYGGAAAIHNLARELSLHSDFEVTIFSLYYPYERAEYNFYGAKVFSFAPRVSDSSTTHRVDRPVGMESWTRRAPISKLDKPGIWLKCRRKFSAEHSRKKFDLIHSMWAGESGYVAAKLSNRFSLPLIANICGGELAEIPEIKYGSRVKFWQKRFVNGTLGQANKIISGSDYITRKIGTYYNKNILNKVVKIPFGVDEKFFYPIARKSAKHFPIRPRRIIAVGSAAEVKAYPVMLKTIKIVKQKYPDLLLEIYGKDDKNKLRNLVAEMGLEENVSLKGFVDYVKIPDALNSADLFVLSSLYESQNLSLIEAAFCGLPIVSTEVGAAVEITGNLAEVWNPRSLAERILWILDNYTAEKEKAVSRVEELKKKFSLNICTLHFVELYKKFV